MTPDVSESLLAGRERTFIEFLLRQGAYDQTTFSDEDIDAYVRPFAALGRVRGSFGPYPIPESAALNRKLSERKLRMPVLAIGAELSYRQYMAEGAKTFTENVAGVISERCGHWIPEERPAWLLQQLLVFFGDELKIQQAA